MGRISVTAAVWLSFGLCVAAAIVPAEFAARRASLEKQLDGTLVLFGKTEAGEDLDGFHQEPNFYYLTGWQEPGAMLLITPPQDDKPYAVLFLPAPPAGPRKRWTDQKAGPDDSNVEPKLPASTSYCPLERFEKRVTPKQLERYSPSIYTHQDEQKRRRA